MYKILVTAVALLLFTKTTTGQSQKVVNNNFTLAEVQIRSMLQSHSSSSLRYPRTYKDGKFITTDMYDWTSGFFPGTLWFLYEHTMKSEFKNAAQKWTETLEPLQNFTKHHDLGFMVYNSYGQGYRLTGNKAYRDVIIQAAKSLCTRYNPIVGSIKSWEGFASWHGDKRYQFPVIIDNMMNLEMLFFAARVTRDTSFRHIAITHALTTLKNHIRPDYSSYHVVCYDTATGNVLARETAQGYADNSTWARGQAWGLYGFTMVYRETRDLQFLKVAQGMANYFLKQKSLPKDCIPLWDMNAGQPGYSPGINSNARNAKIEYKDASAAAITASALLELSTYSGKLGKKYVRAAKKILSSLSGKNYLASPGENGNFIMKHCVGSVPHKSEIDVPLVYADYYFLEALLRYKAIAKNESHRLASK